MVCPRCKESVRKILIDLKIPYNAIHLGNVEIVAPIPPELLQQFSATLDQAGFQLLEDKNTKLINQIKSLIIDQIHFSEMDDSKNYSVIISNKLYQDYAQLSRIFSTFEGITIERFVLLQRIEKVKELISYNELNFTEIADRLNYSSVAHLSAQFKKITGMTPTTYKSLKKQSRTEIDNL